MNPKYKNVKEIIDGKVTSVNENSEIAPRKIKNCLIAIILRENKGAYFKKVKNSKQDFRHKRNFYFIIPESIYLCGKQRYSVYLEGISTPFSHMNITYETRIVEIINPLTQEKEKREVRKIKGLKYDSKLLDVLLNTRLAQMFLSMKDSWELTLTVILLIALIVIGIANIYISYTYV